MSDFGNVKSLLSRINQRIIGKIVGKFTPLARYTHVSLNLSVQDSLSDASFTAVAHEYMSKLGYKNQPYIIVKHNDKEYDHVHIISTTVKQDLSSVNTRNDRRRSQAITRQLEKDYSLVQVASKSSKTKDHQQYITSLLSLDPHKDAGVRFYIEDQIQRLLSRYKFRSTEEFIKELTNYQIKAIVTTSKKGTKGIAFGLLSEDEHYNQKTGLIPGSRINRNFSFPKLSKRFEANTSQKFIKSQKMRLKKQVHKVYDMFSNLYIDDLPNALKNLGGIDITLTQSETGNIPGYKIYDKSKYIFKASEIDRNFSINSSNPISADNTKTTINFTSKSTEKVFEKIMKEAYSQYFIRNISNTVFESDLLHHLQFKDLQPYIENNASFKFISSFIDRGEASRVTSLFENNLKRLKEGIREIEAKEYQTLLHKGSLADKVINIIAKENKGTTIDGYAILQSLGARYNGTHLSHLKSNKYNIPFISRSVQRTPKKVYPLNPAGARFQNYSMLSYLIDNIPDAKKNIKPTSYFLPMYYPDIYNNLPESVKELYEKVSLGKYLEASISTQQLFERNQVDFIQLLNSKGIFITYENNTFKANSILSTAAISLSPQIESYLKDYSNLSGLLDFQKEKLTNTFEGITKDNALKSLWITYLIEHEIYDKAAYLLITDKQKPLIDPRVYNYHLENGLQEQMGIIRNQNLSKEMAALYKKAAYIFRSAVSTKNKKSREMFNGFKDELTDFQQKSNIDKSI